MPRRRWSTRDRAKAFADNHGICGICEQKIDGVRDRWDLDHVVPLALGGDDVLENMEPVHAVCHRAKTRGDVGRIAKAKRSEARHTGAKRSRNPLPGSRDSRFKRKIDGTVERR